MYLKTTYRNHCEEGDSKCADHCRVFALSDAADTDVQKVCSHSHNVNCEDCEKLKSVLEEVKALFLSTQFNWVGSKRKTICMKQKMLPLRSLNGEGISREQKPGSVQAANCRYFEGR